MDNAHVVQQVKPAADVPYYVPDHALCVSLSLPNNIVD